MKSRCAMVDRKPEDRRVIKPTLTEWLEKEIAEDVEERWIFMLIKNKIKSGEFRGL